MAFFDAKLGLNLERRNENCIFLKTGLLYVKLGWILRVEHCTEKEIIEEFMNDITSIFRPFLATFRPIWVA